MLFDRAGAHPYYKNGFTPALRYKIGLVPRDLFRKGAVLIYAMSDIHGHMDAFEKSLSIVDLTEGSSTLVLCGDYCDRGPSSMQVLQKIMDLQNEFPGQVIALRGNHEEMLLEYCDMVAVDPLNFTQAWILADSNLATAKSFLDVEAFCQVKHLLARKKFHEAYRFTVRQIEENHADVLAWVRTLPYFYETPRQVFVHAGLDEEAGDLWRVGTPPEFFTAMSPEYVGQRFDLDVISGHVSSESVSGIAGYRGVWYDGASHFFIDGCVVDTGVIPVLAFDEATGKYWEKWPNERRIESVHTDELRRRSDARFHNVNS